MLSELTTEELAAGLDRVAHAILDDAGVSQPPVSAFTVAEQLGIAIAFDDRQPSRARYVRLNGRRPGSPRATILLRPEPRVERRHWAVAHEIGEHMAHRVFQELAVDPREAATNAREQVANHIAGRILLPTAWFSSDGSQCGWNLAVLKARYATASHELIVLRMLECRPPVIVSVFDHARMSWRRSNLPGRVPPPSPREMACWREVHEQHRPTILNAAPHMIQGWPVHEEGWLREILRTEVEEIADF